MKFILFTEGDSDHKVLPKFLKKWLDQRLDHPVGIKAVKFEGWAELYKDTPLRAKMYLNDPKNEDIIAVISVMDLYGPTFYPNSMKGLEKRYSWAKSHMEKKVDHPKFHQFFAVHELEAWLLSQPEIFPMEIQKSFPKNIQKPETVNFKTPPAKLLNDLYTRHKKRKYKKIVNGVELFDKLDPNTAYEKCPKLKKLLDTMLELAR